MKIHVAFLSSLPPTWQSYFTIAEWLHFNDRGISGYPSTLQVHRTFYKNSSQGPAFIVAKIVFFHDILLIILESCSFSCIYLKVKVAQLCLTLCDPMDYIQSMEFSRPEYWSGWPFPSPGDLPKGIKLRSPTLQADSLLAEPQWKPKNTGVDSLSLLQHLFLTQELNWGLVHCRRILYHLSYYLKHQENLSRG